MWKKSSPCAATTPLRQFARQWSTQPPHQLSHRVDTGGTSSALARSGLLAPVLTAGRSFTPIAQLQQVTGNNREILGLSTWKGPYPHGDLGVIKKGAYADILLIDGDPTKDIRVLMDSANIALIMKDGKIYKNAI